MLPKIHQISGFVPDEEDSSEFDEWLSRFNFALDCTVPNSANEEKVKYLKTKLSSSAFSKYTTRGYW